VYVEFAYADAVNILAWNITGGQLSGNATNQEIISTIFSQEDADVLLLSETGRGASEIAAVLDGTYTLVASSGDGQDIWVRDSGRFSVDPESTGSWSVSQGAFTQDGVWAELTDAQSQQPLFLYNVHVPIPENFQNGGAELEFNNTAQQQGICDIIGQMETDASNGIVIIGGDFNDVGLAENESVIEYLTGTGVLNAVPGCSSTNIGMTEAVSVDVTHILGTGAAELYSNSSAMSANAVGFGQHGYVTTTVALNNCDLKLTNGRIFTFDQSDSEVNSLTIIDDTIQLIGAAADAATDCSNEIDLEGRVVIPGLIDNHAHWMGRVDNAGNQVSEMENAYSWQDTVRILNEAIDIQNVPAVEDGVAVAQNFLTSLRGINTFQLAENSKPDLATLDQVDRPVLLAFGFQGTDAVANTAARTFFENRGINVGADGSINGTAAAAALAADESASDRQRSYIDLNRWAASVGLTTVMSFDRNPLDDPEIVELYENGTAFTRLRIGINGGYAELDDISNDPKDDMIKLTHIGEFCAFCVFGQGPGAGFGEFSIAMAAAGVSHHQHMISNDAEVDAYLSAWEVTNAVTPITDLRWLASHVFTIGAADMSRLAALGGGLAIQSQASGFANAIGNGQSFRAVYDSGLPVSAGTDGGNCCAINPWRAIYYFVAGIDDSGVQRVATEDTVTVMEAIDMYTMGSAWDTFDEDKLGSLESGKFADLSVLNIDPFAIEANGQLEALREVASVLTIVSGDIVYSDGLVNCNGSSAMWFRDVAGDSCLGGDAGGDDGGAGGDGGDAGGDDGDSDGGGAGGDGGTTVAASSSGGGSVGYLLLFSFALLMIYRKRLDQTLEANQTRAQG
jgi:predicted amidohydrolase YtcJ